MRDLWLPRSPGFGALVQLPLGRSGRQFNEAHHVSGSIDWLAGRRWMPESQDGAPTCVAHAVTAALELLSWHETGQRPAKLSVSDLDGRIRERASGKAAPADGDRTRVKLDDARACLAEAGVPTEAERTAPASPGMPKAAPAKVVVPQGAYMDRPNLATSDPGNAKKIHAILVRGPVVIAMPGTRNAKYKDWSIDLIPTSWTESLTWQTGVLPNIAQDEEPVSESGHAVCVVGFQEASKPTSSNGGGWFVFRNSWGVDFGADAPTFNWPGEDEPRIPARGYGAVSARCVDDLCWEWLGFR